MRIYCDSFVFLSRERTDRTSMIYWMKLILNLNIPHHLYDSQLRYLDLRFMMIREEDFFWQKCDISRKDQNNFIVVGCDEMQKRANVRDFNAKQRNSRTPMMINRMSDGFRMLCVVSVVFPCGDGVHLVKSE